MEHQPCSYDVFSRSLTSSSTGSRRACRDAPSPTPTSSTGVSMRMSGKSMRGARRSCGWRRGRLAAREASAPAVMHAWDSAVLGLRSAREWED